MWIMGGRLGKIEGDPSLTLDIEHHITQCLRNREAIFFFPDLWLSSLISSALIDSCAPQQGKQEDTLQE